MKKRYFTAVIELPDDPAAAKGVMQALPLFGVFNGGTVIAVGTTTARTLESFASTDEMLASPHKDTRILITPGHRFKHVGALMTNFHLPRSTLLAMVAAFLDDDDRVRGQGLPRLIAAYGAAISRGYRFYSFGDAMLILP